MEVETNGRQTKKYSPEEGRKRYLKYKHVSRAYYQRNREAIRAKQKEYRLKNMEKIREQQKNPKYKVARQRWFDTHQEATRIYQRRYYREVVKPRNEASKRLKEIELVK